jgi:hypothetical protein
MVKTCEVCNKNKSELIAKCPVSQLMGQNIQWNYCRPCYMKDLEYVKMIKEKFKDDPQQLTDFLNSLKK